MKQQGLQQNQKLLIQAFKLQNDQVYDEALQKLQAAGNNLIRIIEKIQYNSQFYMKHMPLMKQQRDLITEKDYKQFMSKNQQVLCRNFEKNAYLALLMQQMEEKLIGKQQKKKWTSKQEEQFEKLFNEGYSLKQMISKFSKHNQKDIQQKYQQLQVQKNENFRQNGAIIEQPNN